jgi:metal-responsive CopG/Arc/MetJ family transcriptional regulator
VPRQKVGITLTTETLERLENLCDVIGLSKSQAISLAVNSYIVDNEKLQKLQKRGEEESRANK